MDYSKVVPTLKKNERFTLDRQSRWDLCLEMKAYDSNVNFYSIRPLGNEFANWIDGKRSVEEIATAVSCEYSIKIKPEHVLKYLQHMKDKGLVHF
jgi:hypothetical protein